MQIKRFEARDMQEALRQVKKAMGSEAIILSTKAVAIPSAGSRTGTRKGVEVVAAIDRTHEHPSEEPMRDSPVDSVQASSPRKGDTRSLQRLMSSGLTPEFPHSLIREMLALGRGAGGSSVSKTLRNYLQSKLMEAVEVTGPTPGGMKIWVFIGPTGVGKTTTLAKLAAQFRLRAYKKITLISLDTYRIGAVDQLRTYAGILHLPLEVAFQPEDLKRIIESNMHQDLLLIDTVGRSPNDSKHLEELRDFLSVHPQLENHLLLSATTKERDLSQIVERFSCVPIKSYIFTKLDETDEYAPLLNQLLRDRKPLSYLTNGQNVPEDIELATKLRVANLFLNTLHWN